MRLIGNQTIDSVLKDFLQEIRERRPPDEHAMGSWYDGIDMLDVQRTEPTLKLGGCGSAHKIIIAGDDLEKAQIPIDLFRVLQRVFELIAESQQMARAEAPIQEK